MSELTRTQARDFTKTHRSTLTAVATVLSGRAVIEDRIRALAEDHLQEGLPKGRILQPGTNLPDDDTYIAHLGLTYEYTHAELRAKQIGEPVLRCFAAIEAAPDSPIAVLGLMTGNTPKSLGVFLVRTSSGDRYDDEPPIYFALAGMVAQAEELGARDVTADLPFQLHLATGEQPRETYAEAVLAVPVETIRTQGSFGEGPIL